MKTMHLPVKLTDEELLSRARDLSQALTDKSAEESNAKSAASGFKARIEAAGSKAAVLSQAISSGEEYREVEVVDDPDFEAKVMRTWRQDTGELVCSRPLTETELQKVLPLEEGK